MCFSISGHSASVGSCRSYLEEGRDLQNGHAADSFEKGGISGYLQKDNRVAAEAYLNIEAPAFWDAEMDDMRKAHGKNKGVTFYHFILSPDPRDHATPEACAEYAKEWAEDRFGENAQAAVCVHTDTGIPHAHVVVNNLDLETGNKLHRNNRDIDLEWDKAQDLGVKYGFRPQPHARDIKDRQRLQVERGTKMEAWIQGKGYTSWKAEIRQVAYMAKVDQPSSFKDFQDKLRAYGYDVRLTQRGQYTYEHPMGYKCKAERLGTAFEPIGLIPVFKENEWVRVAEIPLSERLQDAKRQLERNDHHGLAFFNQREIEGRLKGIEAIRREGTANLEVLSAKLEDIENTLYENTQAFADKHEYLQTIEGALYDRADYKQLQTKLEMSAEIIKELPKEEADALRKSIEKDVEKFKTLTQGYAERPDLTESNLVALKNKTEGELELMKHDNIDLIDRKHEVQEAIRVVEEVGQSPDALQKEAQRIESEHAAMAAHDREVSFSSQMAQAAQERNQEIEAVKEASGKSTSELMAENLRKREAVKTDDRQEREEQHRNSWQRDDREYREEQGR